MKIEAPLPANARKAQFYAQPYAAPPLCLKSCFLHSSRHCSIIASVLETERLVRQENDWRLFCVPEYLFFVGNLRLNFILGPVKLGVRERDHAEVSYALYSSLFQKSLEHIEKASIRANF